MKKFAIAFAALLVLIAFAGWNVWHAVYEPVTSKPSLVEEGRQQLHVQLEQAKTREAEIEKQDWDTVSLLRGLIEAHQHRIDQLKDNGQAGEIVAHDREAIARIEKRIADLQAQQAAQAAAQSGDAAETAEPGSSGPTVAPEAAKPGQRAVPAPASPKPAPRTH
ncbi:hypothetical protein [Occallatibacter riparius]|uniref:Uncharacterized protein n=1 Tax=Occallatibacter riparius TaxID=1002689 RepID=A0A9J7BSM9_9BACT|nr:hypothetical protein [Occallatibacter riparius]UWZ83910.1 hypothetical protein MOP44_25550 [Occallatibacter riparius]